ncbi:MAG TPA: hypothetical protein VFI65_22630 [Streptosporangiaceae bacterium]|nr:hypothetical protein [Streptosporangiaceae bacterium]
MPRTGMRIGVALAAVAGLFAVPGPAGARTLGPPGVWTRIVQTDSTFNQVGMARTGNGNLHLVWRKRLANGHFSYGWSTVSERGKLLGSGPVLSNWIGLQNDPKLVPDHSHLRLIFVGGQDTSAANFFSRASVYTETSANGTSWSLVHGTMDNHTVLNRGLAAVVEKDGATPVAGFGLNNVLFYHVGVDPTAPATAADGTAATGPVATGIDGDVFARDKTGSIWVSWSDRGYWARRFLPSAAKPVKAPQSGTATSPDNAPGQQVAFAARVGGGEFLAYCSPSKTLQCAHINLWKVGSAHAMVVPGSATGHAGKVALAAAPGGHLWVSWFDFGTNQLHVVRTNAAVSRFGAAHLLRPPPTTFIFAGLQSEGSSGRLDLVVNVLLNAKNNPIWFWHTQVLAGLALTARPASFSHKKAATVTFTVTDVGDPVAGATVSCGGKQASTDASGHAKLKFSAGTSAGTRTCSATRGGYQAGKTTIRIK